MEPLPDEPQHMELRQVSNFQGYQSTQPQVGNIPPYNHWHPSTNSQEQPLLGNIRQQNYPPAGNTDFPQPPPSYYYFRNDYSGNIGNWNSSRALPGLAPYLNFPIHDNRGNQQRYESRQTQRSACDYFKLFLKAVWCLGVTFLLAFLLYLVFRVDGLEDRTSPCQTADVKNPRMRRNCLKEFPHINKTEVIEIIQQLRKQELQDRARAINNTRMPNGPVVCATNLILGQQADKKSTGTDSLENVVGWTFNGSQTAFIKQPCISHNTSSGQFTVQTGGIYLITSHLSFNPSSAKNTVFEQWIHSSLKTSPVLYDKGVDRDQELSNGRLGLGYNSVASSVVFLHDGEVLTVQARPSALLIRNTASFFSLYKLG